MSDQSAVDAQRRHAAAVLANEVRPARRWGRPYRAYSAYVRPGPGAAAAFSAVQDGIASLEPGLLRVPGPALHANVAWLLPGSQEFDCAKDEIWRARGKGWVAALGQAVAGARSFQLRFTRLVATDSAIIAIAAEPNGVSALRRELAPVLDVPGGIAAGGLVHTTLFRYSGRLRDPVALLQRIAALPVGVRMPVAEVLVVRERVFPSLDYEILRRLALPPAGPVSST